MPEPLAPIDPSRIREARRILSGLAVRTPLVALDDDVPGRRILLKLENLQPIGSFKIRGAGHALSGIPVERLRAAGGVVTASAGNMAQGVAWTARRLGLDCTVVVPEHAPTTKVRAVQRLGATVERRPFDVWWRMLVEHGSPGLRGHFVHPVADPDVIAGNGTIGLEILEDCPDVDCVVVPFGGGGLISGIASAIRAERPHVRVLAAEVATAAPLRASLDAGEPTAVARRPSFVDGIGGSSVLPEMWPLVRSLVDDVCVVEPDAVARAVRMLVTRAGIVAEGAGATPVAVARAGSAGPGTVVCVVSGGNLDDDALATILSGGTPAP